MTVLRESTYDRLEAFAGYTPERVSRTIEDFREAELRGETMPSIAHLVAALADEIDYLLAQDGGR